MVYEKRLAGLVSLLRSCAPGGANFKRRDLRGRVDLEVPRIGLVQCHSLGVEYAQRSRVNEVWATINGQTYRGSAETVAKLLLKQHLQPKRSLNTAIAGAVSELLMNGHGLWEPEIAAKLNLGTAEVETVCEWLNECGVVERTQSGLVSRP